MSTDPTGSRAGPASASPPVAVPAGAGSGAPSSMKGRRSQARTTEGGDRRALEAESSRRPPSRKPPPRRKRKVRKVHRVVRHIEVWSVAKLTAVFVACGYLVGMISGFLLWQAADRVGTLDGFEGFMEDSGSYDSFEILGDVVFRFAAITGIILGFVVIAVVVLGVLLFNLVSDITGGVRMTVIDEDLIVAPARRPEADPARRPEADPARRPEADPARRPDANGRTESASSPTANEPVGD